MGFVNCALEESERRTYRTPRMSQDMVFGGGTTGKMMYGYFVMQMAR